MFWEELLVIEEVTEVENVAELDTPVVAAYEEVKYKEGKPNNNAMVAPNELFCTESMFISDDESEKIETKSICNHCGNWHQLLVYPYHKRKIICKAKFCKSCLFDMKHKLICLYCFKNLLK